MSSFATAFWSSDQSYAGGLGVLFGKLQQGVQENQQILTIARMRAEAEDVYGLKLGEIEVATLKIDGGFARDDGASVKKAYDGVRVEMIEAAKNHRKIASNIRELVVSPFSRWCDAHAARVQNSHDDLQARIKAHDKQADSVRTYRSQYYNKCRRVEDLDEEEKLAFQDPQSEAASSPRSNPQIPTVKLSEPEEEDPEPVDIGDETYMPEQVKKILSHMLDTIKIGEQKVPILGTYQNVSNGADITEYIQKNMNGTSLSYAERIGQDLVDKGFLRLIGNVGSTFANSSRMHYQWRPKVFQMTGYPEKRSPVTRSSTINSLTSAPDSPRVAAVGDLLAGWNPLNNAHPNETSAGKLRREASEADERYKAAVRKLDALRCNLEEAMIDHLKFMERCELDRLKAIKSVILDFSGAVSNVIPSLQSTVDKMMLFQETVQPLGDLRYLLENYRTGPFVPRVTIYENYYNNVDEQTFGVDIEARARSDRKRVPIVVTTLLTFLDNHYPDLEGDEARRQIWLFDVPLAASHHLRSLINTGKAIPHEVMEKYEIPIVASVLKLYLLELPDSLVSSHVYEIVKTIYTSTAPNTSESARITVIQSTLGQLRLANIATLDAIITHFTRLMELTSADEAYVAKLATVLAPCILRPKQENSLSMAEKFSVRLVRDLFAHKNAIFGELKRQSSLTHTNSGAQRPRAISTDESRRREHFEERQRAIIAAAEGRGRASSPMRSTFNNESVTTSPTVHRRDRSASAQTRFPVAASNPGIMPDRRNRASLEVPSSPQRNPVGSQSPPKTNGPPLTAHPELDDIPRMRSRSDTNGTTIVTPGASENEMPDYMAHTSTATDADSEIGTTGSTTSSSVSEVEKRNSLNRSSAGRPYRKAPGGLQRQSLIGKRDSLSKRDSAGSMGTNSSVPVSTSSIVAEVVDSPVGVEEGAEPEDSKRGVELVDKPMDD